MVDLTRNTSWFFRVRRGAIDDDVCCEAGDVAGLNGAWDELRWVGADLMPDAVRRMGPDDQWCIEVLDAGKNPVFRIRLVSETATRS